MNDQLFQALQKAFNEMKASFDLTLDYDDKVNDITFSYNGDVTIHTKKGRDYIYVMHSATSWKEV